MDILKLTDVGERLGLHGKELHDFVRAEQERERASRLLEREVAKEMLTERGKMLRGTGKFLKRKLSLIFN